MARVLAVVREVCHGGAGAGVVVWGSGGIGKSAFLDEVCRQAARMGAGVANGSCDQIGRVSPGAPVIAALRSGREPLADACAYEEIVRSVAEPLTLVERIASVLEDAAAAAPIVVAIDDVRWTDRISRLVIRMLLSQLIGLPVVWMLAGRDREAGADLLGCDRLPVEWMHLGPLAGSDVAAIALDRLGRVPEERTRVLLDAAGGNPLLATQILDSLERAAARGPAERVPLRFNALIAQRLTELAEAPRDVAALVAVAGRAIDARDIAGLLPRRSQPAWENALAAVVASGLVERRGDVLKPRHDLVAEAVCDALPEESVRTWHHRLAEYYLDAVGDASVAAAHARAAAVTGDVAGALILLTAAERLAEASPEDAGDLATLAFRTVRADQGEWLDVGRRCLSVPCRTERATEAVGVADAILARVDDENIIGAVESEAAQALWLSGRLEQLLARTAPVLDYARLDPGVSARLHAARALADTRLLPGQQAATQAAAALERAQAAGEREALALALDAVGEAARNEGRHRDSLHTFQQLRTLTGTRHLAEEITALQHLDRYDVAQTLLDEVTSGHGESAGSILPALQCARLWQGFNLGRCDETEADTYALLDISQQFGNSVYALNAVIVQTSIALLRGDTHTAVARLEYGDGLIGTDDPVRQPGLTVVRCWLAAAQGDLRKATRILFPVVQGATSAFSYWQLWPCWMGMFYQIGSAARDSRFAQSVVQIAELAAERNPGVASLEGLALNVRARFEGDLALMTKAADAMAQSPRPVVRAYSADCLGRAFLKQGDKAAALMELDRAWDDYNRIDARFYRVAVQRLMRDAGARRSKWSAATERPESGWASLTEAERRVALLIADGHTNRSTAELGVSVNTIGTHLRLVFTKLDVQSHVQLANTLGTRRPPK